MVEKKLSNTKAKLTELEMRTATLDEDVTRIDDNVIKLNNGVVQWYREQSGADEEMRKRVTKLESFMLQYVKDNVNGNGGGSIWNTQK